MVAKMKVNIADCMEIYNNLDKIEWILRIAAAGEFIGHGVFAL